MIAIETTPADVRCIKAQHRRDQRKAEGVCINGVPASLVKHGAVVSGGKCQRCIDVARASR